MKKSLHSLIIAAVVSFAAVCANAAETVSEAVVLKVTGNAQATLPGQSRAAIQVGDKLPQGTVIETPDNSAVDIQAFSGNTTTIQPGSKVELNKLSLTTDGGQITKQTAEIGLSLGTVVASLDPSKKGINDYSIRTPKGVAAARGTSYTVNVTASGEVTLFVATGVVTLVNESGQSVTLQPGQSVKLTPAGTFSGIINERATTAITTNPGASESNINITIVSPSS